MIPELSHPGHSPVFVKEDNNEHSNAVALSHLTRLPWPMQMPLARLLCLPSWIGSPAMWTCCAPRGQRSGPCICDLPHVPPGNGPLPAHSESTRAMLDDSTDYYSFASACSM